MDMMSPETFGFIECIDKKELNDNINKFICSYCKHYCNGQYDSDCRVCKVSLVCQQIALSTIYQIPIDNAPTVAERPKGEFTRKELENWLYQIAFNNTDNELSEYCEEIISRLNGFERFVSDMRGNQ